MENQHKCNVNRLQQFDFFSNAIFAKAECYGLCVTKSAGEKNPVTYHALGSDIQVRLQDGLSDLVENDSIGANIAISSCDSNDGCTDESILADLQYTKRTKNRHARLEIFHIIWRNARHAPTPDFHSFASGRREIQHREQTQKLGPADNCQPNPITGRN